MTNTRKHSIRNVIGKYNSGELTFGEMLKRLAITPTVRNLIIVTALIGLFASTKDIVLEKLASLGNETSTEAEFLEQIIIELPIKKGDTLNKIAERFGTTAEVIAKYNGIADPNKIQAGDTIKIALPLETEMDVIKSYEVKENDTIESICKENKMSVEEFLAINPGTVGVVDGDKVNVLVDHQVREYRHYLVEEGDTIESLVEKYQLDINILFAVNGLIEGQVLEPGEILVLLTEEAIYETYEVKKDETIGDLAEKFDVEVTAIMDLNQITEVIPGEKVLIPSRKATEKKILGLF